MRDDKSSQANTVNLTRFKLQQHVEESFRTAWALSAGQPINARHALLAVLIVSKSARSPAFSKFSSLFPLTTRQETIEVNQTSPIELRSFPLDFPLAKAYSVAERFILDGMVWGRDYITFALLAVSDPSLQTIAEDAGLSLEELQDEWYRYVTSDRNHRRDPKSWTEWWRKAGVPLPDERGQRPAQRGQETSRNTYLLTWNPKRFAVDYLVKLVRELDQRGVAVMNWSVGNHGISIGDRVFLIRHGEDMPGLIGSGHVVSDVQQSRHWDETKPADWTAYYVDVEWDFLSQLPLIPLKELIEKTGEDKLWTTEGSGLPIPQHIGEHLEVIWKEALAEHFEEGPSAHIATDIWTLDDTLGYEAYAQAIYHFIKHKETKAPLTVSIQAPWGGGKTSLMRMIQKLLDPKALIKLREEPRQQQSDLTIRGTLDEIDEWIRSKANRSLPEVQEDKSRELLTVWFNAWKYESTNQVWAGLADAIMKQVAARLKPIERERFWLRLNLKRLDPEKIRRDVYDRILNYTWRGARGFILGSGLLFFISIVTAIVGQMTREPKATDIGWWGIGFSTLISFLSGGGNYFAAKKKVEKEPASLSFSRYLKIPDYNKELGFVHNVESDLHRVFAAVPEEYRPIVIFIDDLDRCSPAKVAQVLEAVNLFLAGHFPHCFFVLGIDSEMVAAALQAAHKDMLASLPADAGIPLGWRFMDKFVQLPFLIPLPEPNEVTRYTTSLLCLKSDPIPEPLIQQALETAKKIQSKSDVAHEVSELKTKHDLDEVQASCLKEKMESQVVERVLKKGIDSFTDKNPEIRKAISAASSYFHGNPRELKRFINVYRFNFFVWWARKAQELPIPTSDQLLRWTILSMKWPELVRWLRRGGGTDWCIPANSEEGGPCIPTETSRLKLIEDISGKANDLTSWQKEAEQVLRLTPGDALWLKDGQLLSFFQDEHSRYSKGERLSAGVGKGLW